MYSTDLHNCKVELEKVVTFARPLKAAVELLHFTWPDEILPDKKLFEKSFRKQFIYPLKLHFEKADITYSVVQRLQKQISISKPSVVIMFTDQKRSLYQRIFLSSKAKELSFQLKLPLLVFNKN